MQQFNDPEHTVSSPFFEVRHNMAILTHNETVYIVKKRCIYLKRNGCYNNLLTNKFQFQILQGILFS